MEETLRDAVESCMKRLDIKPAELARRSGVPYSTLQDVLAARGSARIETIQKIAKGLDVHPGALLGTSEIVTEKEREIEERLRLLNIVSHLDSEQVAAFLEMIERELGISRADILPVIPNKTKKA